MNPSQHVHYILYHLHKKYIIIIPFFLSCFSSIMAFQRQTSSGVSFSKRYSKHSMATSAASLFLGKNLRMEHAEGTGSGQPVTGSPTRLKCSLWLQELGATIFSDERNEISFKPISKLPSYFWVRFQVTAQNLGPTDSDESASHTSVKLSVPNPWERYLLGIYCIPDIVWGSLQCGKQIWNRNLFFIYEKLLRGYFQY